MKSHNVKVHSFILWKKTKLKWIKCLQTIQQNGIRLLLGEHPTFIQLWTVCGCVNRQSVYWMNVCYCVEMSDTMVCMMRDPRGQLIKSMLGFLIFSSKSWSSSQRSSFTNSATYIKSFWWNTSPYTTSIATHTRVSLLYLMRRSSKFDPSIVQRDNELSTLQVHAHSPPTQQHHGIYTHHATVTDKHSTGLHFLVVHQVWAVIVTHLKRVKLLRSDSTWGNLHLI